MKTADGYPITTLDTYPVAGKDPADYNYPLFSLCSSQKTYSVVPERKTYTVVIDQ